MIARPLKSLQKYRLNKEIYKKKKFEKYDKTKKRPHTMISFLFFFNLMSLQNPVSFFTMR